MKNFIALNVFDGFEFPVADEINGSKKGLAFTPCLYTYSHRSRYSKKVIYDIKPMFEGYVFVQFPTDQINFKFLSSVKGIIGVVNIGDVPAEIRPAKMWQIINDEVERERLTKPSARLHEDPVTRKLRIVIESGALSGVSGDVVSYDPKKNSIAIQTLFFGVKKRIDLPAKMVPEFTPDLLDG